MVGRNILLLIAVILLFSSTAAAVPAQEQEPNVGLLRVYAFNVPAQVAPNKVFVASVGVKWAIHGRPDNATLRAAIYKGVVNLNDPLWQSEPTIVHGGGDMMWNVNVTSPASDGYLKLTAYAFYLDQGKWHFFNNTTNGPGFVVATIKIGPTASLRLYLGRANIPVSVGTTSVKTSINGEAQIDLSVGNTYIVSVPATFELSNSTRFVFLGWNDGKNGTQRNVALNGDVRLVGSYRTQYLLQINSPVSPMTGWYDVGSTVEIQTPASTSTDWPLSIFGLRSNFNGWSGDLNSAASRVNVTMNGPKTLNANFAVDYGPAIVPAMVSGIIVVGILGAIFLSFARRRRDATESEQVQTQLETQESALSCASCGKDIEKDWTFCIHCGKDLGSSSAKDQN